MVGYVRLFRKFTEWEWYQDGNVTRVFLHLLLRANYEEKRWKGIVVKRGQVVTSNESLAGSLNMSIHQVRTALEKLERTGEIGRRTTNQYTLVTICKYNSYQDNTADERQTDGNQMADERQTDGNQMAIKWQTNGNQMADERQTDGNQMATTKEYKEYKEREEDNPHTYAHACVRVREEDERFYAEMKRGGTQWQEDACRTLKITLPELADLVCQFEVECRAKGTTHISWKDASSHFIDWGRRQVQSRQKQQYYGSRNKENIDKRGGFEPADNTDYSA
jgi:hypothetical protein